MWSARAADRWSPSGTVSLSSTESAPSSSVSSRASSSVENLGAGRVLVMGHFSSGLPQILTLEAPCCGSITLVG